jgi:hypothetical protein
MPSSGRTGKAIHALVNVFDPAASKAVLDLASGPELEQLIPRDESVLPSRDLEEPAIEIDPRSNGASPASVVVRIRGAINGSSIIHAAEPAARLRQ